MARPLSFLILAIAVACAALFLLLPMSKIAQHRDGIEAVAPKSPPGRGGKRTAGRQQRPTHQASKPILAQRAACRNRRNSPCRSAAASAMHRDPHWPIVEVEVTSQGFGGESISGARVVSDRQGEFTLQLVPERQYQLRIRSQRRLCRIHPRQLHRRRRRTLAQHRARAREAGRRRRVNRRHGIARRWPTSS